MNLDKTLEIYADIILNPSFPDNDFQRLKRQTLAQIQREKVTPIQMALRVFPGILYGEKHAYGLPLTGSGSEASVTKITRADLEKFHQTWFKPNNATLVIAGDITLAEIKPKLEKLFSGWKSGNVPKKNIAPVAQKREAELYIVDRPGSQQSIVFAGHLAPERANPQEEAIQMMNNILGGDFTSRLNMNIREDKHWSYGAGSFLWSARGQRPFIAYTSVQQDKTKETIQEFEKEMKEISSTRPPSDAEFEKTRNNTILALPGSWETINDVRGSLSDLVRYGLPDDYYQTYAAKIRKMPNSAVQKAAKDILHLDKLVWVVVGDRSQIEAPLKSLGFKTIRFVDADGKVVE
jgi:zinc protease